MYRRDEPDNADLLAAHFQYYPGLDLAGQRGRIVEVDVGGDDRELQRVNEGRQHLITFVKLVATERHGVIAEQVHDLRIVLTQPLDVEEGAGEAVAGVEQQTVGDFSADLAHDRRLTRCAAIPVAVGLMFGIHVIAVHDGEREAVLLGAQW